MAGTRLPDGAVESFRSLGDLGPRQYQAARRQGAPNAPEAELERIGAVAAKVRPEVVRTVADLWNNGYPGGARPSGFNGPTLLLPGADDPLATAEVVNAEVAGRFDAATTTLTAIEQAGHWPHLERPCAVAAEIRRFLAADAVGKQR
jgi:esterase